MKWAFCQKMNFQKLNNTERIQLNYTNSKYKKYENLYYYWQTSFYYAAQDLTHLNL